MGVGIIEPWHLVLILIIALVVFGPGKLGDVGGALGRGIREFKSSMTTEEETGQAKPVDSAKPESATKPENTAKSENAKKEATEKAS